MPTYVQLSNPPNVLAVGFILFAYLRSWISLGQAASIFSLLLLISMMTKGAGDPYGAFHLKLNKLPGEPSSAPPKTEWLNMGYWKVHHSS
jgi:hypothetical protein